MFILHSHSPLTYSLYYKIRFLSDFRFKEEHVEYLKTILPDADEGFLEWLRGVDCSKVTVKAIKEGSVVFPRVPLLIVEVFSSFKMYLQYTCEIKLITS
jgi:nicotinic acid phosphoribosyltransferase